MARKKIVIMLTGTSWVYSPATLRTQASAANLSLAECSTLISRKSAHAKVVDNLRNSDPIFI